MSDTTTASQPTLQESTNLDESTQGGGAEDNKTVEEYLKEGKVVIFYKSAGNAPKLKTKKFKFPITTKFQNIIEFLRKQLKYSPMDPLYLFINESFQPSPDETVADLFRCFHVSGKLIVTYCTVVMWG